MPDCYWLRSRRPRPKIHTVSGYLGAGYAFGKGLYAPGWRVRAVGSLGSYDYRGTLFDADADLGTTFDGDASYGAALLGYQSALTL